MDLGLPPIVDDDFTEPAVTLSEDDFPLASIAKAHWLRWPAGSPDGLGGQFKPLFAAGPNLPGELGKPDPDKRFVKEPKYQRKRNFTPKVTILPPQQAPPPPDAWVKRRPRKAPAGDTPSERATVFERAKDLQAGLGRKGHKVKASPGNRQKLSDQAAINTILSWKFPELKEPPTKPGEAKLVARKRAEIAADRLSVIAVADAYMGASRRLAHFKSQRPVNPVKIAYYRELVRVWGLDPKVMAKVTIEKSSVSARMRAAVTAFRRWEENMHPRAPKGTPGAGRFTNKAGGNRPGGGTRGGVAGSHRPSRIGMKLSPEQAKTLDDAFKASVTEGSWSKWHKALDGLKINERERYQLARDRRETYESIRSDELDKAFDQASGDKGEAWERAVKKFKLSSKQDADEWNARIGREPSTSDDGGSDDGSGDVGSADADGESRSRAAAPVKTAASKPRKAAVPAPTPEPEPSLAALASAPAPDDSSDDDYEFPPEVRRALDRAFAAATVKKPGAPSKAFRDAGYKHGLNQQDVNEEWGKRAGARTASPKPAKKAPASKKAPAKKAAAPAPDPVPDEPKAASKKAPAKKAAPAKVPSAPAPKDPWPGFKPKGAVDSTPAGQHLLNGGSVEDSPADGLRDFIAAHPERFKVIEQQGKRADPNDPGPASAFAIYADKVTKKKIFTKQSNARDDADLGPQSFGDLINEKVGADLAAALGLIAPDVQGGSDPDKPEGKWLVGTHLDDLAPPGGKVAAAKHLDAKKLKASDPLHMSLLDFMMANDDRHHANWKEIVDKDGNRRLVLYDFGGSGMTDMTWGGDQFETPDGFDIQAYYQASYEDFIYGFSTDFEDGDGSVFNHRSNEARHLAHLAYAGDRDKVLADIDDFIQKMDGHLGSGSYAYDKKNKIVLPTKAKHDDLVDTLYGGALDNHLLGEDPLENEMFDGEGSLIECLGIRFDYIKKNREKIADLIMQGDSMSEKGRGK